MVIAKHILNTVLILALLFSSLRISVTYIYHYLDPVGFTEKLCENKDKPELECNGKCYLMKMASSEDQESKSTLPEIEYLDLQLFIEVAPETQFAKINSARVAVDMYRDCYKYLYEFQSFHPPRSVI